MYHYFPTLCADNVQFGLIFWFRFMVRENSPGYTKVTWYLGRRCESFCFCSSWHQMEGTWAQFFAPEFHSLNYLSLLAKADSQMYHLSICIWQSWENVRTGRGVSCHCFSVIMLLLHHRQFEWFCCIALPVQKSAANKITVLLTGQFSCENSQHLCARTIPHHSHLTFQYGGDNLHTQSGTFHSL